MGVGYFVWFKSSSMTGKLRRSHNSWSRFVLKMLPSGFVPAVGSADDTVVGQVELEAELDDDALEIDEAVERNDDALSEEGRRLV
jgi:hypothetical protein